MTMKKKDLRFSTSRSRCYYSLLANNPRFPERYNAVASFASIVDLVTFVQLIPFYHEHSDSFFVYDHLSRRNMSYHRFYVEYYL